MSINNSPYGPPQYYFYPPPVSGSTPITAPPPLPTVQVANTAVFTPKTPPKDTISVGKAAKYGAGISAAYSLVNIGLFLLSKRDLLKLRENKIPVLIWTFRGMAIKSTGGALFGALLGYFLKRSQKQG